MRISDWSSDVCSSDLCHFGQLVAYPGFARAEERQRLDARHPTRIDQRDAAIRSHFDADTASLGADALRQLVIIAKQIDLRLHDQRQAQTPPGPTRPRGRAPAEKCTPRSTTPCPPPRPVFIPQPST